MKKKDEPNLTEEQAINRLAIAFTMLWGERERDGDTPLKNTPESARTKQEFQRWKEDNLILARVWEKVSPEVQKWLYLDGAYRLDKADGDLAQSFVLMDRLENTYREMSQVQSRKADAAMLELREHLRKQHENLQIGRPIGQKTQREHAQKVLQLILKINSDLQKHPDTARMKLDERANFIEQKLLEFRQMQVNGKPYQASTIRKKITGKG